MRIIKQGGHRLFEQGLETTRVVSEMLSDLEKHGMDAVRWYSQQFDDWALARFELSPAQIEKAIARLPEQVIEDTAFCMANVRRFTEVQFTMFTPLETTIRPGVIQVCATALEL